MNANKVTVFIPEWYWTNLKSTMQNDIALFMLRPAPIQRINYRLALFRLDQASLLLKYEFRAEALNFPLVTRHKKGSFL